VRDQTLDSRLLFSYWRSALAALLSVAAVFASDAALADDIGGEPIVVSPESPDTSVVTDRRAYRTNDDDDWKFLVSINPWFIFVTGEASVLGGPLLGNSTEVDQDFGQIWKALHMAMMADVEVQKGDFGMFTDISWARLWYREEGVPVTTKTDIDWVLFDFGFYWEALSLELGKGELPLRLRLQPYVGGRYLHFGVTLDRRSHIPALDKTLYPTSHNASPILGLRGFLDIDEHWNFQFVGDGGGFGVDDVDVTWLAEAAVGYRIRYFKRADVNILVGYKGVGVDVRSSGEPIEIDLSFHGPVLKVGVEF
jgi:hypothetical protein